jgi:hypothetical protein
MSIIDNTLLSEPLLPTDRQSPQPLELLHTRSVDPIPVSFDLDPLGGLTTGSHSQVLKCRSRKLLASGPPVTVSQAVITRA